jgi:hypothetical protein
MLVHIGYQKASSTFLQQRLFLPQHGYWQLYREKQDVLRFNAFFVDPPAFKFDADAVRQELQARLSAIPDPSLVPVISAEILVGIPIDAAMGTSRANADRIVECVPDARVLVIVREQRSLILSRYLQFVRGGGVRSLEEFAHGPHDTELARSKWTGVYPAFFEYDRLISYYRQRLGAERILVLAFEQLREDPVGYLRSICAFAGAQTDLEKVDRSPVKEAIPASTLGARRIANALVTIDPDNPFSRAMPAGVYWRGARHAKRWIDAAGRRFDSTRSRAKLTARLERILGDFYVESNRRLAAMTGLDLAKYGYRT